MDGVYDYFVSKANHGANHGANHRADHGANHKVDKIEEKHTKSNQDVNNMVKLENKDMTIFLTEFLEPDTNKSTNTDFIKIK
jgi:hypothetical protein